jgi:hypothetical protein
VYETPTLSHVNGEAMLMHEMAKNVKKSTDSSNKALFRLTGPETGQWAAQETPSHLSMQFSIYGRTGATVVVLVAGERPAVFLDVPRFLIYPLLYTFAGPT